MTHRHTRVRVAIACAFVTLGFAFSSSTALADEDQKLRRHAVKFDPADKPGHLKPFEKLRNHFEDWATETSFVIDAEIQAGLDAIIDPLFLDALGDGMHPAFREAFDKIIDPLYRAGMDAALQVDEIAGTAIIDPLYREQITAVARPAMRDAIIDPLFLTALDQIIDPLFLPAVEDLIVDLAPGTADVEACLGVLADSTFLPKLDQAVQNNSRYDGALASDTLFQEQLDTILECPTFENLQADIIDPMFLAQRDAIIDPLYDVANAGIIDPLFAVAANAIIDPLYRATSDQLTTPQYQEGHDAIIDPLFAQGLAGMTTGSFAPHRDEVIAASFQTALTDSFTSAEDKEKKKKQMGGNPFIKQVVAEIIDPLYLGSADLTGIIDPLYGVKRAAIIDPLFREAWAGIIDPLYRSKLDDGAGFVAALEGRIAAQPSITNGQFHAAVGLIIDPVFAQARQTIIDPLYLPTVDSAQTQFGDPCALGCLGD